MQRETQLSGMNISSNKGKRSLD